MMLSGIETNLGRARSRYRSLPAGALVREFWSVPVVPDKRHIGLEISDHRNTR